MNQTTPTFTLHPTCTKHHKATRLVQPFRVGTVEIEEVDVTHAVEQPI